jgi:hypothetical protein
MSSPVCTPEPRPDPAPLPYQPIPRIDATWFRDICELGPRPLVVTGWLKIWLQGHFASQQNIEDQTGAVYKSLWKPDFKQTRIAIESITKWAPELTEFRPAVIIKRNAWKRVRLGVDDRMMGTMAPDMQNRYSNVWQGSHTLFCIAGDGAEAEKLAAEVFRELNEFGPIIRRILDLMRFEVLEVGELYKVKTNARENFAVPVTIGYAYREDWKVMQEAPRLKRIDLAIFQP